MADWKDEELARYKADKERAEQEAKEQKRHADLIKKNAPRIMQELTAIVAAEIADYQSKPAYAEDRTLRIDFKKDPARGFTVDKTHYPAASLVCGLHKSGTSIVYRRSYTRDARSLSRSEDGGFDLIVNAQDEVVIGGLEEGSSLSDIAESLLRPVLRPPV
jgi:hypothetical protein